jgi:hypothetical protein
MRILNKIYVYLLYNVLIYSHCGAKSRPLNLSAS